MSLKEGKTDCIIVVGVGWETYHQIGAIGEKRCQSLRPRRRVSVMIKDSCWILN